MSTSTRTFLLTPMPRPHTSTDDVRDMMVRKIVKMRARLQELGVTTTLRQAATAEQIYETPDWGDDVQTI